MKILVKSKPFANSKAFFWNSTLEIDRRRLYCQKSFMPPFQFYVLWPCVAILVKIEEIFGAQTTTQDNTLAVFGVMLFIMYLVQLIPHSIKFNIAIVTHKKLEIAFITKKTILFKQAIYGGGYLIKFRNHSDFQYILNLLEKMQHLIEIINR